MRIDVAVSEARAANARASASSELAAGAPALPAPSAPGSFAFAAAMAACNAALTATKVADTALNAGVVDLDRRTAQAVTLYEVMNEQNREALS